MKPFILLFLCLNLITFSVFGIDKLLAHLHLTRISEKTLLALAIAGGSVGAVFAQKLFRHKTRKFRYRVWIILASQFIIFEILWYFFPILVQNVQNF
ncbi:MAG: DUF1294 domain-containing protein [Sulfuricurvum sp.]|nr:DUF1294 domain-containing protein [Sulfuricurvum sp.]MDD5386738.1 DUF1294 domain-containing protein [Sulfuricurvum sp.]